MFLIPKLTYQVHPTEQSRQSCQPFTQRLQSLPGVLKIKLNPQSPIGSGPGLPFCPCFIALTPGSLSVLISNPHPYSWLCPSYLLFLVFLVPASKLSRPSSSKIVPRARSTQRWLFIIQISVQVIFFEAFLEHSADDTPFSHFLSHVSLLLSSQKLGLFPSYASLNLQCPALASATYSHALTCSAPGTIPGNKDSGK